VNVDVILCNHVEGADGKLYLSGGGIDIAYVAPNPPHVIAVGLGIVVHLPYTATNQAHRLRIALVDEDDKPAAMFQPEGAEAPPPLDVTVPFNVGRPANIAVGDEQSFTVGTNMMGLPLANLGKYIFVVEIDGTEVRRLPLRVTTPPTQMISMGLPSAS
jgi:hypothetical protein